MSVHRVEFTDSQITFLATLLQKIDSGSRFYGNPHWKGSNARERELFDGLLDKMLSFEDMVNESAAR